MSNLLSLTSTQLKRAATLKGRINSLEKKLAAILGAPAPAAKYGKLALAPKKKRKMSAAGRARIRAAQKARWAKVKSASSPVKSAGPGRKKKFKMSAAAKAKISAAAKARWAKIRAAKTA
jgi:hypothetical protein